jgi:signal peptidase II
VPPSAYRTPVRYKTPPADVQYGRCMLVAMTNACRLRRAAPDPLASRAQTDQAASPAPAVDARPAARARPVLLWTGVALLSLAADAGTKAWALAALRLGHRITVADGLLRLQLVANHGAAFGIGAGYEPLIVVVSVVGAILLGIWACYASTNVVRFGATLAAAGAAGNILDRLIRPPAPLHGAVTDWIHVSFYGPTFNLADVWLRAGILIAAVGWLWTRRSQPGRPSASPI